jgi:hypothetical protein
LPQGFGELRGADSGSDPVELIETLRNIAVREGFEAGHSIQDISDETGLPVLEVFQREKDLHLIPANEVYETSTARPA